MDPLQKKLLDLYNLNEKVLDADEKDQYATGYKSGYLEAIVAVSKLVKEVKYVVTESRR